MSRRQIASLAVSAGVTLAAALTATAQASTAPAATRTACWSWHTTAAGHIAGVHTSGEKCELDNGRAMIDITIQDVKKDGKAACAQVHATYADHGTRDEWVYIAGFRHAKTKGYTFASSVRTIWVREGTGNNGRCTTMAKGTNTIWL